MKIIILINLLFSSFAFSGDGYGKVKRIYAHWKNDGDGVIMFNVETHSNAPEACPGTEWAFNAKDPQGQAMYSLLLSAAAQGKSVVVKGAGDCRDWSDRERPIYIYVDY